jgi:hypothetical protein
VGAADPAVDAEEFDSIGFAAQCLFAGCRQSELESCEGLAVAERRRRGQWCACLGLEEPRLSLPEGGEGSVEPGVADEGSLLEPLCFNEGGGRCARAGGDRVERPSFGPREPVCRRGQLLEQPPQRRGDKRQLRALTSRPLGQCRRLGGLEGGPSARGYFKRVRWRPAAGGPERLGLARRQLAQTGEGRLAGEGADDDQLGRGLLGVGER